MKKLSILYFLLAIPSLSFTTKNDSFISLTGFEVEIIEENNIARLYTRYTSTTDVSTKNCVFNYSVIKDGVSSPIDQKRLSNFKKVTNQYLTYKPEIDIASLGNDNYFVLKMLASDSSEIIEKKIHFNVKGNPAVTFKEIDNDIGVNSGYEVESYSLYDESKNFLREDRITFSNFEDLVVEDYYLNFDIKRFSYKYTGNINKTILDGQFYLLIYDKYNLFKDLPLYKDSQYRYIELKTYISNNESKFLFKNNIYYDPATHNASINYKEGYLETDKLYFPIGKLNILKNIHCVLSLDIEGYTKFNMSGQFDIYFLKNYFGDCDDSEYCIKANSDDGDNVREKVVEVDL